MTANTIKDLTIHADILDLMGLSATPYNKINIHVGATYKDKPAAIAQFLRNWDLVPDNVKCRFTLEKDDKPCLYTTEELYNLIYKHTNIPIVFDHHHHTLNNNGMSHADALAIAVSTWGNVKPVVHYSQSRSIEQNIKCPAQAHSDSYWETMDTCGYDVDIMLEAKFKEIALFCVS